MTVVELRAVTKSFVGPVGSRPVLAGVDLRVDPGEIIAVSGRSGSGKTTLLTLVAGWEQPDAGTVIVLDDSRPPSERPWAEVAILPQTLGLLDELTVAENVGLPLRLGDVPDARTVADELARLGLDRLADRFPDEISLGEQQRAALARAAVVRPRLLLADEPISHQNEGWARASMALLEELTESGTSCLLATHNEIAFGAAARVLALVDGRLADAR